MTDQEFDDSDCCSRCGDLLSLPEIVNFRDVCMDDDAMPTYCGDCLIELDFEEVKGVPPVFHGEPCPPRIFWRV